jgi:hypothetical protein
MVRNHLVAEGGRRASHVCERRRASRLAHKHQLPDWLMKQSVREMNADPNYSQLVQEKLDMPHVPLGVRKRREDEEPAPKTKSGGDDSDDGNDIQKEVDWFPEVEPWLCRRFSMLPEGVVLQICEFVDCKALGRLDAVCLFFHIPREEFLHLSVTEAAAKILCINQGLVLRPRRKSSVTLGTWKQCMIPELSWMETRDSCQGFRRCLMQPLVVFAVAAQTLWDLQKDYAAPPGFHWASTSEGEALFDGSGYGPKTYFNKVT